MSDSAESLIGYLQQILRRPQDERSDAELLTAFSQGREEHAFATLMSRYGVLVWGVCRRILKRTQDAEDAFQAAFLALAQKGGRIRSKERVGYWLYTVACRASWELSKSVRRRQRHERQELPAVACASEGDNAELLAELDKQIERLPRRYREALLLCRLAGKSYAEAARELGCSNAAIGRRVASAERLLRKRFGGLALAGGGLFTDVVSSSYVSASFVVCTVEAATLVAAGKAAADIPAHITALTEGVLKTMRMTKLKALAGMLLAVFLLGGVGLLAHYTLASTQGEKATAETEAAPPSQKAEVVEEVSSPTQSNKDRLQGTWESISIEVNGKKITDWVERLDFVGDKLTRALEHVNLKSAALCSYKLDDGKNPNEIDITYKRDKNGVLVDVTERGIYVLEGTGPLMKDRANNGPDKRLLALQHELRQKELGILQTELLEVQSQLRHKHAELRVITPRWQRIGESVLIESILEKLIQQDPEFMYYTQKIKKLREVIDNFQKDTPQQERDLASEKLANAKHLLEQFRDELRIRSARQMQMMKREEYEEIIIDIEERISKLAKIEDMLKERLNRLSEQIIEYQPTPKLDSPKLRICLGTDQRPTEFNSRQGRLVTFIRRN